MRKALILILALLAAGPLRAEELHTEVVELGYTSVADIMPVLKPLVPAPGSVGGLYNMLVLNTTPDNLDDLLLVIQTLDRPPRNLMITVRHGLDDRFHRSGSQAETRVSDSGAAAAITIYDTRSSTNGTDTQRVRVLEGKPAFVHFGESVPVAQRSLILFGGVANVQDSIDYVDVGSGFYAVPRLSGNRVVVSISPERSRLDHAGGGVIDVQSATTTVSGRLGEWLPLGGTSNRNQASTGGTLYSTRAYDESSHSVAIRVDPVD